MTTVLVLGANGQIALRYVNPDGSPAAGGFPANPNGAIAEHYLFLGPAPAPSPRLGVQPQPELLGRLDGRHVPTIDLSRTYQGVDFGDDLVLEGVGERRFFSCPVASTGLASQMASLTSSNLPQVERKSRYVATSRSTFVSNGPGRSCKVLVLPSTLVVKA